MLHQSFSMVKGMQCVCEAASQGISARHQSFSMVRGMQYVCEAAALGISPSVWLEECNMSVRHQRKALVLQSGWRNAICL